MACALTIAVALLSVSSSVSDAAMPAARARFVAQGEPMCRATDFALTLARLTDAIYGDPTCQQSDFNGDGSTSAADLTAAFLAPAPAPSPTAPPPATWSSSPTASPSITLTPSPTVSPSAAVTTSPPVTPSRTTSPSPAVTSSPTGSPSQSASPSRTVTLSGTPTGSPTRTASLPPTASPSTAPSTTPTVSPTQPPSVSPTAPPTHTRSPSPSQSATPTRSATVPWTATPSRTASLSPSATRAPSGPNPSTYLGGVGEDQARDVTSDAAGNIYVTGGTASAVFPLTADAYDTIPNGSMDVFVAKLAPDGRLLWSSLLGGPNYDRAYAIELAPNGDVIVAGRAGAGFPTTSGVVQPAFAGDSNPNGLYGQQDGFVAALSADGRQLRWATYIGGPDRSFVRDVDVDASGAVVVALTDVSQPSPHVTAGAFQTSLAGGSGALIARLSAGGTAVDWATYLDGSGVDGGTPSARIGNDGTVYVLGYTNSTDMPTTPGAFDRSYNGGGDLHLARLQADGRQLVYGTFLGGSGGEYSETHGLALRPDGRAVVAATTTSSDFPAMAGSFQPAYGGAGGPGKGAGTNYAGDGFVAIVNADGSSLFAATYLGGAHGEGVEGVALRSDHSIALSGATYSPGFPTTPDAAQPALRGQADMFVAVLSPDLRQLVYGTFIGGNDVDYGRSLAGNPQGSLVTAGQTRSTNWPVAGAIQAQLGGGFDGALAAVAP